MDVPSLDPVSAEALESIVSGPEAWSVWDHLAARWPGVLERMEEGGLVERWPRPDYLAVTLTPWGAYVRHVWIRERVRWVRRLVGKGKDAEVRRVPEAYPVWDGEEVDHPDYEFKPAGEVPLLFPERRADPRALVLVTDDDGEPVRLFGLTIPVSPLIRGKR